MDSEDDVPDETPLVRVVDRRVVRELIALPDVVKQSGTDKQVGVDSGVVRRKRAAKPCNRDGVLE